MNTALNKIRSRRRKPEQYIDDLLPKFLSDGHQAHPAEEWRESAEVLAQRRETRILIRQAIQQLPHMYRAVLILRDIEGLETNEAAEYLGVSPAAVKTRLHRARLALRTILDPHFRGGAL